MATSGIRDTDPICSFMDYWTVKTFLSFWNTSIRRNAPKQMPFFMRNLPLDFRTVSNDIVSKACPSQRLHKGNRNFHDADWNCVRPSWKKTQLLLFEEKWKPSNCHRQLWKPINEKDDECIKQSTHVVSWMNNIDIHSRPQKYSHCNECNKGKLQ